MQSNGTVVIAGLLDRVYSATDRVHSSEYSSGIEDAYAKCYCTKVLPLKELSILMSHADDGSRLRGVFRLDS